MLILNTKTQKMPIEKEWLIKLNEGLPYGSIKVIYERLVAKYGIAKAPTKSYIRSVLCPDNPRTSQLVIDEAIIYRDELIAYAAELKARIFRS